jgi:hypothetical protein
VELFRTKSIGVKLMPRESPRQRCCERDGFRPGVCPDGKKISCCSFGYEKLDAEADGIVIIGGCDGKGN